MSNCNEKFGLRDRKTVADARDIFNSAFPVHTSEEELYNKHFLNPSRISEPIRIRYIDEVPAGMNAFMGMHIINNEDGKVHYIAQSNDTAVLPAARGKGVFTGIVEEFEKNDSECEYCIGIPNNNSYHGFLKMGWKECAELRTMTMKRSLFSLLNQPRTLRKSIVKKGNSEYRLLTKAEFSEVELSRINAASSVLVYRTNQYINWKISNQQSYLYLHYFDSTLQGYLIFHLLRKRKHGIYYNQIVIDDWYYIDQSVLQDMVRKVSSFGYYIYVSKINRSNDEYNAFIKCGFYDNQDQESDHLLVSPRGQGNDYLKRLSIRELDGDYILNSQ